MSTTTIADDDKTPRCAGCTNIESPLLTCSACKLVKYCSVRCQKKHHPQHKEQCLKRAIELYYEGHNDDALFKPPPPQEDCPICCVPMHNDTEQRAFQPCCGQMWCGGCGVAASSLAPSAVTCPFCRNEGPSSVESFVGMLNKLVDSKEGNGMACFILAGFYEERKIELYTGGAKLGCNAAMHSLALCYDKGTGVPKNRNKAIQLWEQAAMAGSSNARMCLGAVEEMRNNKERAIRHWMIAAMVGDDDALKCIKEKYDEKRVTEKDFNLARRVHTISKKTTTTEHRKQAAIAMSHYYK